MTLLGFLQRSQRRRRKIQKVERKTEEKKPTNDKQKLHQWSRTLMATNSGARIVAPVS